MEVQCETYELSPDAVPSTIDYINASDSGHRETVLREAGLDWLADNAKTDAQLTTAGGHYPQIAHSDVEMYRWYYGKTIELDQLDVPPPDTIIASLMKARKSEAFDAIELWEHPGTGVTLAVGLIATDHGIYYFRLGRWGNSLITTDQLAKHFARKKRFDFINSPLFITAALCIGMASGFAYNIVTGFPWFTTLVMLLATIYWVKRSKRDSFMVIGVLLTVISIVSSYFGWNDHEEVREFTICDYDTEYTWYEDRELLMTTSQGIMALDDDATGPGSANNSGWYFDLVGQRVSATTHGKFFLSGATAPVITDVEVLGTGNCG